MARKIVVALGGNAILSKDPTAEAQQEALRATVQHLMKFVLNGDDLIVTHGNGPQVGNLLLQNIAAHSDKNPAFPLDTLVAMTEGSIGYWLQNAFQNALQAQGVDKEVVSLITQVVVDGSDPAFADPAKPIGPFYTQEEAEEEMARTGATFKEDAGRGWRKVVPSPLPIDIQEAKVIKELVAAGHVVISAGGGGIPVVRTESGNEGVEAVIDKDFASAKLAELIGADSLLILTGVDNVYVNFNQPNQEKLEHVTVEQLRQWITENQFAPGSMLPKVEAAIQFVESCPTGQAVITSLDNIGNYLQGGSATVVTK
ncbi:carbamate kinase [Aerococcaceae bacterium NML191292]|nr:carbamate kinase [Aerococcaceae bacterium NML191292]